MSEEQKQQTQPEQPKFPSEIIDLPSEGKIYSEGSPLRSGKIEIKYMTAREEDILTSQNLIKKGLVIEQLLDSLIMTPGVKTQDLYIGDKNAVMVAARILAYGPEYVVSLDSELGGTVEHKFNLSELEYRKFPEDLNQDGNEFVFILPTGKNEFKFKLLTGKDETAMEEELKSFSKINETRDITTRLKWMITSIDGNDDKQYINNFVDNMLARDSLAFRKYWVAISPDILLQQEIVMEGGDEVLVDIPMTTNFFWPTD